MRAVLADGGRYARASRCAAFPKYSITVQSHFLDACSESLLANLKVLKFSVYTSVSIPSSMLLIYAAVTKQICALPCMAQHPGHWRVLLRPAAQQQRLGQQIMHTPAERSINARWSAWLDCRLRLIVNRAYSHAYLLAP